MTDPTLIPFVIFALPLGFILLICGVARLFGFDTGDDHE